MAMRSAEDRVGLLDIETTYGVAAIMTAADAILLMDSEIQPLADKLERNVDKPHFGADPFALVGKRCTFTAKCDLLGPPAADLGDPAPLGKLYRICGHAETLVAATSSAYNPISVDFESGTFDFYWAGVRFRMLGVRGSMDADYTIKQYSQATVNLTGMLTLANITDAEPPVGINWDSFQTPAAIEAETWIVLVNGVNVCAQQLTMQANATINLVECSEGREVMYTDRKPTGVIRVFKDSPLATWNPFALADSQAIVTLSNTITKGAGLNVAAPIRAQLEYPKPISIDGIAGFEIPYSAVPSGAGGDEYSWTFT